MDIFTTDWNHIKFPNNLHIFWIVFGEETPEVFSESAKIIINEINTVLKEKYIEVEGKKIPVELFLVCDMTCLVLILKLYDVFKPNTCWKCPWCLVSKKELDDFNIQSWPLRELKCHKTTGANAELSEDKTRFAGNNYGIEGVPLFNFE